MKLYKANTCVEVLAGFRDLAAGELFGLSAFRFSPRVCL